MTMRKYTRLGVASIMMMSIVFAMAVPAPAAEARQDTIQIEYEPNPPCPRYSIQDIFDDPGGDWDRDRVSNKTELDQGMDPCDPVHPGFCTAQPTSCTVHYRPVARCQSGLFWTQSDVDADPNGDWDQDGVKNHVEASNGANPCAHPCPRPTTIDVALNPNGSWDNDGISNSREVFNRTNPCVGIIVAARSNPCPQWTADAARAAPNSDWDGDSIINSEELRRGLNPCQRNATTGPTSASTPNPAQSKSPPKGYTCPAGYPDYSATTGYCHGRQRPIGATDTPPKGYTCPAGYPYYSAATGLCHRRLS